MNLEQDLRRGLKKLSEQVSDASINSIQIRVKMVDVGKAPKLIYLCLKDWKLVCEISYIEAMGLKHFSIQQPIVEKALKQGFINYSKRKTISLADLSLIFFIDERSDQLCAAVYQAQECLELIPSNDLISFIR